MEQDTKEIVDTEVVEEVVEEAEVVDLPSTYQKHLTSHIDQ